MTPKTDEEVLAIMSNRHLSVGNSAREAGFLAGYRACESLYREYVRGLAKALDADILDDGTLVVPSRKERA